MVGINQNNNERKIMAIITITLQDVGDEVKVSVKCSDKEGFLKRNERGQMIPVSPAAGVACGMIAMMKIKRENSNNYDR